jgi:hypothetical protein
MTQLSIRVKGDLVRKGLQDLGAEIPRVGRQQIYFTMRRIKARMSKAGKKPSYPIKWDSEKQRKAFFASDGFGHGIPTRRTGTYINGWTIEPITNGYKMVNQADYAKFLGGDAYGAVHSGIHIGRYEILRDVTEEEVANLPKEIEDQIVMVARRAGF